jgi:TPR repeat protein
MDGLIAGTGIFWLFLVIMGVVWLILPFAVFGIKNRLDQIISIQGRLAASVESIERLLRGGAEVNEPTFESKESLDAFDKANQGNAEAQMQLGWMYYSGEGVPRNYVESHKWYRKAAEQGNKDALEMSQRLTKMGF